METMPYDPDAPAPPSRPDGSTLGRYTLARRVGFGGMGEVYEATHRDLGKRVALKVLRAELAARPQVRARFAREGVAASRLRHPHVVDVSDFVAEGDDLFLVMEYLDGESLEALLAREGRLSASRIASVMLPVCAAVDAAHRAGIVHRDLKPANIFLARTPLGDEVVKVLDFGISKLSDGHSPDGLTASAATLGTSWYMSPEQVLGAHAVTSASDQFALGTLLYECAAGRRPFVGASLYLVMRAITEGQRDPVTVAAPDAPAALVDVIERALSTDPSARFSSVADLARALLPLASAADRARWSVVFGEATTPAPLATEPSAPQGPASQLEVPVLRPPRALIVAAAAIATTILVAAIALRPREGPPTERVVRRADRASSPLPRLGGGVTDLARDEGPLRRDASLPSRETREGPGERAGAVTPTSAPTIVRHRTAPATERRGSHPRPGAAAARTLGVNGAPIEE